MSTDRLRPTLKRALLAAAAALPFAAAAAGAQGPTPEGTVITNTATATYTDANSNTYGSVSASASVTVGFLAGVDVTSPAQVTPASPSTGNVLTFTLNNTGNGRDTLSVSSTAAAGVTVTGYKYAGTTYPTVAALNTALSTVGVNAGTALTVDVIYDVLTGQGGKTIPVTMTEVSKRSPTTTDVSSTDVKPPVAQGVSVTPDNATPIDRLPSNGTQYTQAYVVTNNGNAQDTFSLVGSAQPDLAIVSVNGVTGTAGGNVTIAAGGTQTVNVVYTVNTAAAAGATDSLKVVATSTTSGTVTDPGFVVVRVVKAAIVMSKQAFKDDKATAINGTTDRVLPGDFIQYKITVTNNGAAAASNVSVTDALPSQLTYDSNTTDAAGWTVSQASGTVTGALTALPASGSRFFWIRVKVK